MGARTAWELDGPFGETSPWAIATLEARDQDEFRDFLMEKGSKIALVTNSWSAQDDAQLSARRSEHLEVLDDARFAQRLNFSFEVLTSFSTSTLLIYWWLMN